MLRKLLPKRTLQKGEEIFNINFYVVFTNLRKPTSMAEFSSASIYLAPTTMYQILFPEPGIYQETNIPTPVDGDQQQIVQV